MMVEESLSEDEDGVPHYVSDSESESKNDSEVIHFVFYILSSHLFLYSIERQIPHVLHVVNLPHNHTYGVVSLLSTT
jgi:hypothetical protein